MKISTAVNSNNVPAIIFLLACLVMLQPKTTDAAPSMGSYSGYFSPLYLERQNPRYLMQTISRLRQALINEDDLEKSLGLKSPVIYSKRDGEESKRIDVGTYRGRLGNDMSMRHFFTQAGRR
ncbi:unnamed protein product [Phyllotreta striolata]|uniref:Uncharacterized protein n=1 Tax=Phyllotreta striolata TaxID=444603 RepID=A0A9P0DWJ5_PHYSR|nr:unnamed protein product [Phyllotreta striolata]